MSIMLEVPLSSPDTFTCRSGDRGSALGLYLRHQGSKADADLVYVHRVHFRGTKQFLSRLDNYGGAETDLIYFVSIWAVLHFI